MYFYIKDKLRKPDFFFISSLLAFILYLVNAIFLTSLSFYFFLFFIYDLFQIGFVGIHLSWVFIFLRLLACNSFVTLLISKLRNYINPSPVNLENDLGFGVGVYSFYPSTILI